MTSGRFRCRHRWFRCSLILAFAIAVSAPPFAHAHEYWLSPIKNYWPLGQVFKADIRNGENFVGTAYPFDSSTVRFGGLISDSHRRPLKGRLGNYPAISFKLEQTGLHLALLETMPRQISYDTVEKFRQFIDYHSLQDRLEALNVNPTKKADIRERYYRFTKSLFNVSPAGEEQSTTSLPLLIANNRKAAALEPQGQRLELVANAVSGDAKHIEITLLLEGDILAGRQIEMFYQAGITSEPERRIAETDTSGKAIFDVSSPGKYLINSVWLDKPSVGDVDWETLWASLTFRH